jgi:glycosyltransferase involved in cell wall biosynthesis
MHVMAQLYRSADVYLNLSEFEGFGLPLAEAILHRLPVVYRKGTGMDEFTDPKLHYGIERSDHSLQSIVNAIFSIVRSHREGATNANYERFVANSRSWQDSVADHASLYNRI